MIMVLLRKAAKLVWAHHETDTLATQCQRRQNKYLMMFSARKVLLGYSIKCREKFL